MINIAARADTEAEMLAFAIKHGLYEQYIVTPAILDVDGVETTPAVTDWRPSKGTLWVRWGTTGDLLTAKAVFDVDGSEITPAVKAPGFWVVIRLHSDAFERTMIIPADPDANEVWDRNSIAKQVKDDGEQGDFHGVEYHKLEGVSVFTHATLNALVVDVFETPGHVFS